MTSYEKCIFLCSLLILFLVDSSLSLPSKCKGDNCLQERFSSDSVLPQLHCNRYSCGRKREITETRKVGSLAHKPRIDERVDGNLDKKKMFRKSCWRFGCRKKHLPAARPPMERILETRTSMSKHHSHEIGYPSELQPRCTRFGMCKRNSKESSAGNSLRHKNELPARDNSNQNKCSRFGCFRKKSSEIGAMKRKMDLTNVLRNMIFHKSEFQDESQRDDNV